MHDHPAHAQHGRGQDDEEQQHRGVVVERAVLEAQVSQEARDQEGHQGHPTQEAGDLVAQVSRSLPARAPLAQRLHLADVLGGRDLVDPDDLLVLLHQTGVRTDRVARLGA